MKCRFCQNELKHVFVDLGDSPPSNSFLTEEQLSEPESFYPLKLYVCDECWLVQIAEHKRANEIFSETYAYFSSFSSSWVTHAKNYVEMIIKRLELTQDSHVIEIASNDGYLQQFFYSENIRCLGIEPSRNTADAAMSKGFDVMVDFFGETLAKKLVQDQKQADLIIGNNVLAHVPDINDFVKGLKTALKPGGVVTMEFPHLMSLVEENQFDTVYHEHFSYLSLNTVKSVFTFHDMKVFDVEKLSTHGGSIRIYAGHQDNKDISVSTAVTSLLDEENNRGIRSVEYYTSFQKQVDIVKDSLLAFLIDQKQKSKKVIAYGAAAKGNTLLNYCGVKSDMIPFVVDASPHKQGKYLPESHIPVVAEDEIKKAKPDFVLILPWNLKNEISKQLEYVRKWGCKFVVPIPEIELF